MFRCHRLSIESGQYVQSKTVIATCYISLKGVTCKSKSCTRVRLCALVI